MSARLRYAGGAFFLYVVVPVTAFAFIFGPIILRAFR
jgi:hypothetical protein